MESILSLPAILIFLFVLTVLSFFFSVSETAIIGLNKIRLRHMVAKGVKGAQGLQLLITKLDKVIVAILVGNNFVNIAMSAIITAVFIRIFGYNLGILIATFSSTFFVLIICEITPKILATKHAEKIALFTAPLMEGFITLFGPFIHIFTGASDFILKVLRFRPYKRSPLITEEELRLMIEVGKEEGVLTDEERAMLHRIFEFGDTKVRDVMVPRDKMITIDINSKPEELLNIFAEEGHARLPVYRSSRENIVGIIYARDLLYVLRDKGLFLLQDLLHKVYVVSPETRINELLRKFQADKIQIAVVADDHQKAVGLVTLENLIEEIVGEIEEVHPSC